MDSSFLQQFELAFQNLGLNDNSASASTSSSTGSSTDSSSGSLPDPRLTHGFDFSNTGNFGSRLDDFPGKFMTSGSSMFDDVGWFDGSFSGNPGLEAISNGGNRFSSVNSYSFPDYGIIVKAMSEDGSKSLQQSLSLNDSRITNLIFDEVFMFIFELMINQFGRYVFQKLIESADENQLQMIMEKLTVAGNYIYSASLHKYGSFSVKKLITVLQKSPLVTYVIKALSDEFENLMTDPTGRYAILECLDVLDSQTNDPLYTRAMEECLKLARHEQGAVAMNGFITRIKGPQRDQLLNLICQNARFLAQDPVGNYVIQCVIGLQNPAINDQIFSLLEGYYVKLSTTKTGSHLVEQCLRSSGMEQVISELIGSDALVAAAKDRYGNYVVQTALKESKKRDVVLHGCLVAKLERHWNCLQHGCGRNILKLLRSPDHHL